MAKTRLEGGPLDGGEVDCSGGELRVLIGERRPKLAAVYLLGDDRYHYFATMAVAEIEKPAADVAVRWAKARVYARFDDGTTFRVWTVGGGEVAA